MTCTKDKTTCGKCVIGLANWSKELEKYLSEFPACVNVAGAVKIGEIKHVCPNSPFPDGRAPDDSAYRELFPDEEVFRYIVNDDGVPMQVLHGNSAVYYSNGRRVEKPVVFVKAKNWPAAVLAIQKRREKEKEV